MENYICINGKKIELTAEQVAMLMGSEGEVKLADVHDGEVFKIGGHEFIVLEHAAGSVLALKKDIICKMAFGSDNNNYLESKIKTELEKFYGELKAIVGEENIVSHTADLKSDDGLKDYGAFETHVSLLTADMYRKYVQIIDKYKLDCWWWLLTPHSTDTHENSDWVKCVSPLGFINDYYCDLNNRGVRPFCIFKSDIFVSVN
jgi:hypothetical protein